MKNLFPIITTTLIAGISALILAVSYTTFKEDIKANEKEASLAAVREAIPTATKVEMRKSESGFVYYIGYEAGGEIAGYAVPSSSQGYSEDNKIVVGYDKELLQIVSLAIASHSETPGLGAEMEKDYFKSRFRGKKINLNLYVVKAADKKGEESEIDSLSGATITSRSVVDAVNDASHRACSNAALGYIEGLDASDIKWHRKQLDSESSASIHTGE